VGNVKRFTSDAAEMEGETTMILAHHSIFSMYGFWLPNDPRGSGSDFIAAWELFRYGRATKVHSRRSVAHVLHDQTARLAAKQSLKYPAVAVTGRQALAIAKGFALACSEAEYQIHACAILPEHVHVVIGAHRRGVRTIVGHLKSRATRELKSQGLWPEDVRPVWGALGWNVWLESVADVERAVRYVEVNPEKEEKCRQRWSFVAPFAVAVARREAMGPRAAPRRVGGAALQSQQLRAAREREGRSRREG
jgi:REP element-mobilizing transposase RayT